MPSVTVAAVMPEASRLIPRQPCSLKMRFSSRAFHSHQESQTSCRAASASPVCAPAPARSARDSGHASSGGIVPAWLLTCSRKRRPPPCQTFGSRPGHRWPQMPFQSPLFRSTRPIPLSKWNKWNKPRKYWSKSHFSRWNNGVVFHIEKCSKCLSLLGCSTCSTFSDQVAGESERKLLVDTPLRSVCRCEFCALRHRTAATFALASEASIRIRMPMAILPGP